MEEKEITGLAREMGFAAAYFVDASLASDAPEGIASLLLLIAPYHSWGAEESGCAWISTYYYAAQKAYVKAKEMAEHLRAIGETAHQCNDVRIKPILSKMKDFSHGRNTIHYHKDFGSRFHVQMIGFENHHPMDKSLLREGSESGMCGSCQRCLKACPTQALTEEGFLRDRCLRQHMMRGTPIPAHLRSLMGSSLVGCDICQKECPYNASLSEEPAPALFPLKPLLEEDPAAIVALSKTIGKNLAIPNRVCAQAIIAAGNSGDLTYLPILHKLTAHPSPIVKEHAIWAAEKLTSWADSKTE